jgi:hypothetical protein
MPSSSSPDLRSKRIVDAPPITDAGVPAASKKRAVTADELCKALSDRAWKILNGEPVERSGRPLNSY